MNPHPMSRPRKSSTRSRLRDLALGALPSGVTGLRPAHLTRELVDTLLTNYAAIHRIPFSHDMEKDLRDIQVPTLLVGCDGDWLGRTEQAAAP